MRISAKYIVLPALFFIAVLFTFASTTQISSATGHTRSNYSANQLYEADKFNKDVNLKSLAGNVQVVNAVCQPAGPGQCTGDSKKPGRDGVSCPTNNLLGGSIRGVCRGGVCTVIPFGICTTPSFTSSADSLRLSGQSIANQVIQSLIQNVMQKLMGGGAAGGGGGFSGSNFGTTPQEPDLLSIDTSLRPDDSTGGFLNLNNLLFGSNDTTDTVNNDTTNDAGDTNPAATPVQAGDTVETTYEQVGGSEEDGSEGDELPDTLGTPGTPKDFTEDLFDPSFLDFGEDTSSSGSLTRADLERQGLLEAARFRVSQNKPQGSLAISYESLTPAEIRSLQDYQSSGVAVSGNLNPFQSQNQNNADQAEQEQQDGFFRKLGKFFLVLFGIGPPVQ